jgi:hypothetical protein
MTDDERTLASLKLLRESSAWMVGVQTAIFGFLITLLNADKLRLGSYLIKGALIAFLLSIVFAGVVLAAIPWVLDRKPVPTSMRGAPIAALPLLSRISIGWVSSLQYSAFVIGVVCLAAAVIMRQIG